MDEKIGLELIKQIIQNRQKVGKDPWPTFMAIDYKFIEQHFGSLAALWIQEQRDLDMLRMIEVYKKNPLIKDKLSILETAIIK